MISDICPVCGMATVADVPSVEHHKMYFHFCSEQCRETFEATPQLYASGAVEKRTPVIKYRNLHLAEASTPEDMKVNEACLKEMMGVQEVHFQGDRLQISYDLMQITQAGIEQLLNELGVPLDNSWWQRARRGWTHNAEENELDNLARGDGACCNRSPPGA